jgi:enoyl-CoA hydratase
MNDAPIAKRLSAREAIDTLEGAGSLSDFSPLTGTSALVVDLDGARRIGRDIASRVRTRLRELPCPTIAIRRVPTRYVLEGDFDVLVRSEEDLEKAVAGVSAHPLAAATVVQVLRYGEKLPLHEALVAESLAYSVLQAGPEFAAWAAARAAPRADTKASAEPAVLVSRSGDRLDVVLNRPERHNAYSVEMRDALTEALELAAADTTLHEIVLSGRGASFSAGGDLTEFGSRPDPATAHAVRSARNAARVLSHCAERVRAEVHGACIGAGAELAAFAAFVIARPDAYFELPEVGMGLIPGAGGTASIPRRIGRQRAAFLALSGARIDAKTALEWGLVDSIRSNGDTVTGRPVA